MRNEFYQRLQADYFAQLHRYFDDRPDPDGNDLIAPPLGDPPF
jgi:hypothetical protein